MNLEKVRLGGFIRENFLAFPKLTFVFCALKLKILAKQLAVQFLATAYSTVTLLLFFTFSPDETFEIRGLQEWFLL